MNYENETEYYETEEDGYARQIFDEEGNLIAIEHANGVTEWI